MQRRLFLLFVTLCFSIISKAQSSHLVISQMYGGGGNSGAWLTHDFIELYNPTSTSVTISNWSVQYSSSQGSGTWTVIPVSATIPSGGYFLIQLGSSGPDGVPLPTPDVTYLTLNMHANNGKIALVNHATALSGSFPKNGVVDLLGYGDANAFEGATAQGAGTIFGLFRANNGCSDFDHNRTDFIRQPPAPRNGASPAVACAAPQSIVTDNINSTFCVSALQGATGAISFSAVGNYATTFQAYLSDQNGSFTASVLIGSITVNGSDPTGTIPITIPASTIAGTGYKIRVNAVSPAVTGSSSLYFEVINGLSNVTALSALANGNVATISWTNPVNCFDDVMIVAKANSSITALPGGDGSAYTAHLNFSGAGTPFDGGSVVYKGVTSGQSIAGLTPGTLYYIRVFTRRGTTWSAGAEINFTAYHIPQPGEIVINQFSPDYNGAADEYIELVNTTNKIFDLSGLAIRYQSAAGVNGPAGGVLSGVLLPHRYWLLLPVPTLSITVGQNTATTRDGSFNDGLAATAGQLGLVRLSDNTIIDAVSYGSVTGGLYTEAMPAVVPPANGGLKRVVDGMDTNNNNADFALVTNTNISLRNSLGTPLPVRFRQVKAVQEQTDVLLSFVNATEQDIEIYEVERSVDRQAFAIIGRIVPIHNNGAAAAYRFYDKQPVYGSSYYRIKARETNGHTVYSQIIQSHVSNKGASLLLVSNPVKNRMVQCRIDLPAGTYQFIIYNTAGLEVIKHTYRHSGNSTKYEIPLPENFKGLYFLKVAGIEELVKTLLVE